MSDFTKSILGFGPFAKKEATPPCLADPAVSLPQVLHHVPKDGSSKYLPKSLASTATTAVSSQSLAYGTTTLLNEQSAAPIINSNKNKGEPKHRLQIEHEAEADEKKTKADH